jgi:hypothetical protein
MNMHFYNGGEMYLGFVIEALPFVEYGGNDTTWLGLAF